MTTRQYEELCRLEAEIETSATNLRCLLEELAELVHTKWCHDEDYNAPNGEEYTDDEIQDLADQVSEIETLFEKD